MTTARYAVSGLTCGYCIAAVMEHVRVLVGVSGVAVDLVKDGPSPVMVTSGPAVMIDQVREAVGEAGFELTGEWTAESDKGFGTYRPRPSAGRGTDEDTILGGVSS